MEFNTFVVDEMIEFLKGKIYDKEEYFNVRNEWDDFVYYRNYSLYKKEAAEILYRFIDSTSFFKYNPEIKDLNNLPAIIASIVCEVGLNLIEEFKESIEKLFTKEMSTKEKINELKATISKTRLLRGEE